jgi:hypothetical protein
MTNEKLLKLAEKSGIPITDSPKFIEKTIMRYGSTYYYYHLDIEGDSFEWSIDSPDLGNVAAVVEERIRAHKNFNGIQVKMDFRLVEVVIFFAYHEKGDGQHFIGIAESFPMALIEAACKALGVEG